MVKAPVDSPNISKLEPLLELLTKEDKELMREMQDPFFMCRVGRRFADLGTIDASDGVYNFSVEATLAENRYQEAALKMNMTFFDIAGILSIENEQPCYICDIRGDNHTDYCKGLTRTQHFDIVYNMFNEEFEKNLEESHGYDAVMKIVHFLEEQDKEKKALQDRREAVLDNPSALKKIDKELAEMTERHEKAQTKEQDERSDYAEAQIEKAKSQRNRAVEQFRAFLAEQDRRTGGKKFTHDDPRIRRNKRVNNLLKPRNNI